MVMPNRLSCLWYNKGVYVSWYNHLLNAFFNFMQESNSQSHASIAASDHNHIHLFIQFYGIPMKTCRTYKDS